jgi:hypothetical protein
MITGLPLGMVSAGLWFALFWLAHIALLHFLDVRHRFKLISRLFVTALAGHLITVATLSESLSTAWGGAEGAIALVAGWLVLLCLFVLYMPFLFVIATSLSVQTMILVAGAPDGRLPRLRLQARFASPYLAAGRLETMKMNGYLTHTEQGYGLTRKGVLVARGFFGLKALWRLGPGG